MNITAEINWKKHSLSNLEDYGDTDSMLAKEIENLSIEMIDEKEK